MHNSDKNLSAMGSTRLRIALLLTSGLLVACNTSQEEPQDKAAPTTSTHKTTQAAPKKARVGIAIPSYVHAVAWIADDKGFFEQNMLQTDIKVMGGSAATMRALISKSTDIGLAGGDAVIKANLAGADLVVVAGVVNRFYHRIIARSEIATPEDLRGKKVGLAFLGGPQDMAVKHALKSMGLLYGKDVQILNMGKEFNRMAALTKGDIQATTSQTPPGRLKELGFRVLADLPAQDVHFPYAVVVVQRDYLTNHKEEVRAFLKGICEGITFYKTEEAESLRIIGEHIRGSDTEAARRERYQLSGPSLLSYPPEPSVAGFQTVLDALKNTKAGTLKPDTYFQLELLRELQREGHCTKTR